MAVAEDARKLALGLSAGRTVVGTLALLAPELTGRLFGYPKADINPSTVTLARMFGVREVAIGAANLVWLSSRPPTRMLAGLNLAVDGGDAAVSLAGLVARNGRARANLMALLVAAPVAGLWARMVMSLGSEADAEG